MRRRVAERVVTHADSALAVHLWELVTAHFQVGHVFAVSLKDDFQQHLVETTALSLWSITWNSVQKKSCKLYSKLIWKSHFANYRVVRNGLPFLHFVEKLEWISPYTLQGSELWMWLTKCFEAEVCEVHVPKSGAIFFPQHFSVSCVALKAVGGFRKNTDDDGKKRPKLWGYHFFALLQ